MADLFLSIGIFVLSVAVLVLNKRISALERKVFLDSDSLND